MKIFSIFISLVFLNFSPLAAAISCDEAKEYTPVPSLADKNSARKLYLLERNWDKPYRPQEKIEQLLAKVHHIKLLSDSCNIPINSIDQNKYFELTGKLFE